MVWKKFDWERNEKGIEDYFIRKGNNSIYFTINENGKKDICELKILVF